MVMLAQPGSDNHVLTGKAGNTYNYGKLVSAYEVEYPVNDKTRLDRPHNRFLETENYNLGSQEKWEVAILIVYRSEQGHRCGSWT